MADDEVSGHNQPRPEQNQSRSEKFLRNIVENIPAMVFVKDADELRFQLFNRAGAELLGYERQAMLGKNDHDLFPAEQANFFTEKDREVLAAGETVDIPEEPIQTHDGERILHTKKIPIIGEDGEPEFLLGISMDITERRRREVELAESRRELEAANDELEAFSYSVAHDLRTPLRSIDGFSQALEEDCADELSAQARQYLRYVREGAQQMGQLIDDLLELSRVTRADLRTEPVDLTALARSAVERLRRAEPERDVDVVLEEDLVVRGDCKLLAIALENLLGNAWKFTGKADEARIEFGVDHRDGRAVFFVRDDGAGFDMDYADKLFGTFQRLHSAHEFEGTGVGLATVLRIIRRHGGEVWAVGEVDEGATVYFTLPQGGME